MDRLFLDTNIVIDLLGERVSFYDAAAKIATLADKGKIKIYVSALSYSTVFYVLSKFETGSNIKEKLRKFKVVAETCDLSDKIINKGLTSNFPYLEDALQYHSAIKMDCTVIITRNEHDFKESEIPVMSPGEYLNILNQEA